jgi:hypothetical protein
MCYDMQAEELGRLIGVRARGRREGLGGGGLQLGFCHFAIVRASVNSVAGSGAGLTT